MGKPEHYSKASVTCSKCGNKIDHRDMARELKWGIDTIYITKYMFRWPHKGGVEDLYKAMECLQSLIDYAEGSPTSGYVDQG
jgi:hypothetical protein